MEEADNPDVPEAEQKKLLDSIMRQGSTKTVIEPIHSNIPISEQVYHSMNKPDLIKLLCKQKQTIADLKVKAETDEELITKMRTGYLKELYNLRDQVVNKEMKGKRFEYLDVHYFEPTENLSSEMCYVLNKKLDEMKDIYENSLSRMQITNH